MTARLAGAWLLAPCALMAQLELYVVEGGAERRVASSFDMGAVEIGGSVETAFRLRNPGPAAVRLERLAVAGSGFTPLNLPATPATMFAGASADFGVRFQPAVAGASSANLRINDDIVLLLGAGLAGPTLLDGGTALAAGATIDFGRLETGSSTTRRFTLENRTGAPIQVTNVTVSGAGFSGGNGIVTPVSLAPRQSAAFDVVCAPETAGAAAGALEVNRVVYPLRGDAVAPPLLQPQISIAPQTLASGQQARLSIRFAAPSPANGAGQLRLDFQGAADPAVGFLSPAGRTVSFSVRQGEDTARFGDATGIDFQTGSTAGEVAFTATLGAWTERSSFSIAPAAAVIDSARALRSASSIDLTLNGFDNTRSAGALSFTFLDRTGQMLGGGPIRANASADFTRHFETANAGGLFALRAVFPVSGAVSQIDSVDVELANSAGLARRNVKMTE